MGPKRPEWGRGLVRKAGRGGGWGSSFRVSSYIEEGFGAAPKVDLVWTVEPEVSLGVRDVV